MRSRKILVVLVIGLLSLAVGCSERAQTVKQEKKAKTTMEDVKKETGEMVETAKSYTLEQRQAYQKELADKFVKYEQDIEDHQYMPYLILLTGLYMFIFLESQIIPHIHSTHRTQCSSTSLHILFNF